MLYLQFLFSLILSSSLTANGQRPGDVRLVGSSLPYEGRLEVFYFGAWGTVCDDRFTVVDGAVACRQLGYNDGAEKTETTGLSSRFTPGTGEILMDGLECKGSEKKLGECPFNGWGLNDCSHTEDVAVICKFSKPSLPKPNVTSVRIACPGPDYGLGTCINTCTLPSTTCNNETEVAQIGIVERLVNNSWYPIPRSDWNQVSAQVVCNQLGYPRAGPIPSIDDVFPRRRCGRPRNAARCTAIREFNGRLSKTVTEGLACIGSESTIDDCVVTSYAVKQSSAINVATIQCLHDSTRIADCVNYNYTNSSRELYRLRGGPTPWKGRVEVKVGGVWGSVCDLGWDIKDANVVCRNLGFGYAKSVFSRSHFGRSSAFTSFSGLNCNGNEDLLSECSSNTGSLLLRDANSYCRLHSGDAGVECGLPACIKDPEVRIAGTGSETFVEVNGPLGWGRLCFNNGLKYTEAHVLCRDISEELAAKFESIRDLSYFGLSYTVQYSCTGDEYHSSECTESITRTYCIDYTRIECTQGLPDLVPMVDQFQRSLTSYPYVQQAPMYYLSCALEEGCLSSSAYRHIDNPSHVRRLLRFDSLTMNYGTSVFLPSLPQDEWEYHTCHQHYHSFEAFISYDVLNKQGEKVAEGHKASFCLEDSTCRGLGAYVTYRCSSGHQGISKNCGDLYGNHLDCQWIDITDLSPGEYIVRQIVNEEAGVGESDYRNNIIQCEVEYLSNLYQLKIGKCSHSDHV